MFQAIFSLIIRRSKLY